MWAAGALGLLVALPGPAAAFDAAAEFAKGTLILGLQINGGVQNNLQREPQTSGISFAGVEPRLSYLPFAPVGASWYAVAVEPGLEGWVQYYVHPQKAAAAGLKAALRLNAVGLGPVVPYLEGTAGAGGTGLDLVESRSVFTFVLEAGAGMSVFVAPGVAVNAGYRLQHVSNGGTSDANRGYNAHTGIVGVSLFFH